MTDAALVAHEKLVAGLLRSAAYPHPVESVERLDTHISTVLLAGAYAYKIKKPVALGFLDFSTAERRRRFCEDELRLNRRTAPALYLDVLPITGTPQAPRIGGDGPALEYAVRMRRFDNALRLDRLARRGELTAAHVDALALGIARLHTNAAPVRDARYGSAATAQHWPHATATQMRAQASGAAERARLDALAEWIDRAARQLAPTFAARRAAGCVRECHGDLHLANVVLWDGVPTPFDAIEFNPELSFIDIVSDLAFAFTDLHDLGLPRLAWRLVSQYLEQTGDYDGLAVLRYYAVYRALVRARVALIHEHQPGVTRAARVHEYRNFEEHLALAEALAGEPPPVLVATTGMSGSGKSTVALALAERLGGVRVRADVERKRLFGLAPHARSDGAIYSAEATRRTYARLNEVAALAVQARVPAIVDAASLKRAERAEFRALAAAYGARFVLLACEAPAEVLRARVARREQLDSDASEAGVAVLEQQRQWREPLAEDERSSAFTLDTSQAADAQSRALDGFVRELLAPSQ
ncbi:MAG: AAA family ATPase [Betaproteobacteria bacterium]|jgi:aminoglycoside phosphotransferase family enzyme/predicted kinase